MGMAKRGLEVDKYIRTRMKGILDRVRLWGRGRGGVWREVRLALLPLWEFIN